jgi:ceramide glucosyltransferase
MGILHVFMNVLLFAGIAGLVCSTAFLVLVLYAVLRFRSTREVQNNGFIPPVSLLKTVCGLEPQLEKNLESFFTQNYPSFEIIFGARDNSDPALRIVERLRAKYPYVPMKIAFSGEPDRPNAKVCSLEKMVPLAATDFYVISDSDVCVEPNYLREIMAPFADPKVGMITCLYRGISTGGFWSKLEALGMSVEMTAGAVVANTVEGMKFALGPTMVGRRQAVEQVGGMSALADYCADDYLLGNRIAEAGWTVVMSHHVINHIVLNRDFRPSVAHQVRWMKSTRFSRPKGHFGTVFTFAVPFGILGCVGALAVGKPLLGAALLGYAILNRVILALAAGWGVVRDPESVKYCWFYPLRDLMGFFFWVASYSGTEIIWRGHRYRLSYGGKMTLAEPSQESRPVAVDHLA